MHAAWYGTQGGSVGLAALSIGVCCCSCHGDLQLRDGLAWLCILRSQGLPLFVSIGAYRVDLSPHKKLCRNRGLESDIATALAAWGAAVHTLSPAGKAASEPLLSYLAAGRQGSGLEAGGSGGPAVLTHLMLPLPAEGDYFWCHKVSPQQCMVRRRAVQPSMRRATDTQPLCSSKMMHLL